MQEKFEILKPLGVKNPDGTIVVDQHDLSEEDEEVFLEVLRAFKKVATRTPKKFTTVFEGHLNGQKLKYISGDQISELCIFGVSK